VSMEIPVKFVFVLCASGSLPIGEVKTSTKWVEMSGKCLIPAGWGGFPLTIYLSKFFSFFFRFF